jgi:hypothetical protein
MPICVLCDDSGLRNSDSVNPQFCLCAAGKQARRQWESSRDGSQQRRDQPRPASFIDIANLDDVNASVDAMRASLLGNSGSEAEAATRPAVMALLYQVAHTGHEVSAYEATQLYDLAKALEGFLGALSPLGRNRR